MPFGPTGAIICDMKKAEALARLRQNANAVRARGATALFLFGSMARDEAQPGSDLDLFIDYDPNKKFSLVDLVGIKHLLEDDLGIEIDITTRDSLHPRLRDDIIKSAVNVF